MTVSTFYCKDSAVKGWEYETNSFVFDPGGSTWDDLWLANPAVDATFGLYINDASSVNLGRARYSSDWQTFAQMGMQFDTSSIPDGDVIESVTFSMMFDVSNPGDAQSYPVFPFTWQARVYAYSASPSETDVRTGGTTPAWTSLPIFAARQGDTQGIGTPTRFEFQSFAPAQAAINKTGLTSIVVGIDQYPVEFDGTYPDPIGQKQPAICWSTSTVSAPRLVVRHYTPVAVPPSSSWRVGAVGFEPPPPPSCGVSGSSMTVTLPKVGYVTQRVTTTAVDNVLGVKVHSTSVDGVVWILDLSGHILYFSDDDPGGISLDPQMLGYALHPTCDASTGVSGLYERRIFVPQGTYDLVVARFDNWPTTGSGEMINHTSYDFDTRAIWHPGRGLDGPGVAAAFTGVTGPGSGSSATRTATLSIEGASFV